jgi:tRNA-specific 2-thiouridylase
MKWGELLKKADELNCKFIATGHYSKVVESNHRYFLQKGIDEVKDQSYFLWSLSQKDLSRTLFPLGSLKKEEVRKIAAENGMEKLVRKPESQEICFIPDNNYRRFLKEKMPDIDEKIGPGKFLDIEGRIVGSHNGYPFYTIGQRKGLNIAMGYPVYVTKIDSEKNTITIGKKEDLLENTLFIKNINLMKYDSIPSEGLRVSTKIRYNNKGTFGIIFPEKDGFRIDFDEKVSGVTPGQSAVFYEGEDVVGGGIIQ